MPGGVVLGGVVLGRPGDDLLSQVLRHSTIGAEEFNGRVRDGIGFRLLARATRPAKDKDERGGICRGQLRSRWPAPGCRVSANRRVVASSRGAAGLSCGALALRGRAPFGGRIRTTLRLARRDKPFGLRGEHWQ